jgi:hypothetical protein
MLNIIKYLQKILILISNVLLSNKRNIKTIIKFIRQLHHFFILFNEFIFIVNIMEILYPLFFVFCTNLLIF